MIDEGVCAFGCAALSALVADHQANIAECWANFGAPRSPGPQPRKAGDMGFYSPGFYLVKLLKVEEYVDFLVNTEMPL